MPGEQKDTEPDYPPDKGTLEYIEYLIKKATPEHDSPMIVDWLPIVIELVARVRELEKEHESLWEDYRHERWMHSG